MSLICLIAVCTPELTDGWRFGERTFGSHNLDQFLQFLPRLRLARKSSFIRANEESSLRITVWFQCACRYSLTRSSQRVRGFYKYLTQSARCWVIGADSLLLFRPLFLSLYRTSNYRHFSPPFLPLKRGSSTHNFSDGTASIMQGLT